MATSSEEWLSALPGTLKEPSANVSMELESNGPSDELDVDAIAPQLLQDLDTVERTLNLMICAGFSEGNPPLQNLPTLSGFTHPFIIHPPLESGFTLHAFLTTTVHIKDIIY